jgi:hypothetical protein
MRIERFDKMGDHKRNPMDIYFKENPWAPDFRPLLGKRKPRGKGIRRIYKVLMERPDESVAQDNEPAKDQSVLNGPVTDKQGAGSYQVIKVNRYKVIAKLLTNVFLKSRNLLSSFRFFCLWLVNKLKRCVY